MTPPTETFIGPPTLAHTHTIILLHGRGSTGPEFASELFESTVPSPTNSSQQLTLPSRFPSCKWIFPSATPRSSTVFPGEPTGWFDLASLTQPESSPDLQRPGLQDAVRSLLRLIRREPQSVPLENVILGGISQGYATAALVLMALDRRLGGFVGLSGWMPFASRIEEAVTAGGGLDRLSPSRLATAAVRDILELEDEDIASGAAVGGWAQTIIFLAHETVDNVVACDLGRLARGVFEACGASPSWHEYDSDSNGIRVPDEIDALVHFLDECVKPRGAHTRK